MGDKDLWGVEFVLKLRDDVSRIAEKVSFWMDKLRKNYESLSQRVATTGAAMSKMMQDVASKAQLSHTPMLPTAYLNENLAKQSEVHQKESLNYLQKFEVWLTRLRVSLGQFNAPASKFGNVLSNIIGLPGTITGSAAAIGGYEIIQSMSRYEDALAGVANRGNLTRKSMANLSDTILRQAFTTRKTKEELLDAETALEAIRDESKGPARTALRSLVSDFTIATGASADMAGQLILLNKNFLKFKDNRQILDLVVASQSVLGKTTEESAQQVLSMTSALKTLSYNFGTTSAGQRNFVRDMIAMQGVASKSLGEDALGPLIRALDLYRQGNRDVIAGMSVWTNQSTQWINQRLKEGDAFSILRAAAGNAGRLISEMGDKSGFAYQALMNLSKLVGVDSPEMFYDLARVLKDNNGLMEEFKKRLSGASEGIGALGNQMDVVQHTTGREFRIFIDKIDTAFLTAGEILATYGNKYLDWADKIINKLDEYNAQVDAMGTQLKARQDPYALSTYGGPPNWDPFTDTAPTSPLRSIGPLKSWMQHTYSSKGVENRLDDSNKRLGAILDALRERNKPDPFGDAFLDAPRTRR